MQSKEEYVFLNITGAEIEEAEKKFTAQYEDRYQAGDFSFLFDGSSDSITSYPLELLPLFEKELKNYKLENHIDILDLKTLLFHNDEKSDKVIFDLILQRAQTKLTATSKEYTLQSKPPKKYMIANNPIANSLAGRTNRKTGEKIPIINAGGFDLPVLHSGQKNEVTAYTLVCTDSSITMSGRPYTEFDSCVMNGFISVYAAGNLIVTPEMICRAMSNRTESEFISAQQKGAVTKSLEKMRHIFVKCDVSEEMQKRVETMRKKGTDFNEKAITNFTIDNYLLSLTHIQVTTGGLKRDAYQVTQRPILLEYSLLTGQLITVNSALLDIRQVTKSGTLGISLNNDCTRQTIKEYLLRRIAIMKNDKAQKKFKQDPHILFTTLYHETGIDTTKRQYTANARSYVYQVLDYWKIMKYITGYVIERQGRQVRSIQIKL